MPDGYDDEAREALLAKAAQAWEPDPALDPRAIGDGSGEDGVLCYLRAYYQRVATEDLAPPSRLAAVARRKWMAKAAASAWCSLTLP